MIQLAIYSSYGGGLIGDYSHRASAVTFASNERGFAECSAFLSLSLDESFALFDAPGALYVQLFANGVIFGGRLEDRELINGGVTITALGYSRAMSDAPYVALWSASGVAEWRPITRDENVVADPAKFVFDTQNRLFMGLQKNASYGNAPWTVAGMVEQPPDANTRPLVGVCFDLDLNMPVGWTFRIGTFTANFGAFTSVVTLAGTGALISRSFLRAFTADAYVGIDMFRNAANAVYVGETGDSYARCTNVRVVSTTANFINTTFTANRAAGAGVTATVGSTARMYAGQRLYIIGDGTAGSESVVVTSVTSSTQFVATFANAHVIGETVRAFVVYADEIASDLVSVTNTLNSAQVSSSTALIASPGLDLLNEVYEDQLPSDILDYLAGIGDTSGNQWEWGVRDNQRLYFRRQGSASRTWYIDVSALDVQRLLDPLANSVYGVYQDAAGRTLRAAATSDATSVARYGLTRRQALSVSSTSAAQVSLQQAAFLADNKDPKPRSGVTINQVFDASGSRWPLWSVTAGDTVIIRNLAPTLSTAIDRIRTFRLSRAAYDVDTDTLTLEPETPRPSLEALLAQVAAGVQRQVKKKK